VVDVEMANEDLVQVVVRDLLGREPLVAATAEIEEELVAVAQLGQPAGRRLLGPCARHASAQGHDPHLIGGNGLGTREVGIAVGNGRRRRQLRRHQREKHRTGCDARKKAQHAVSLHR